MKRAGIIFSTALLLTSALGGPARADSAQHTEVSRLTANMNLGGVVQGAWARLTRGSSGLSMTLSTRELRPGHAYTVWWITFDRPENCITNPLGPVRCGAADVFNPLAAPSHTRADGGVAEDDDSPIFSGHLKVGDPPEFPELGEGGLANPAGAEVSLVLRDHGPAVEGSDQTTTMNGGCLPPPVGHGSLGTYPCENQQAAMFPGP